MGFTNAGMLHSGNLYCIEHAIKNLPTSNPIIEIGAFCGLSTNVINFYLMKHERKNTFFNCDAWIFDEVPDDQPLGNLNILHKDYKRFVKETYMKNVNFFSMDRKPFTMESTSDEFFKWWSNRETVADIFGRDVNLGGNISFCYIDGDHKYEFAKRDFINTDKVLDAGGFILFDDSSDDMDLGRLMNEIMSTGRYRKVIQNPNYLFVKER